MRLLAGPFIIVLCYVYCCLGTLVQFPSHSCFQEDLTFMCTRPVPVDTDHLVNLLISVLHYPPFDTSRLIHSNAYTDPIAGTISQNVTLKAVTPSEAPAIILCISVLWSNRSNTVIDTHIESNATILVAPHPAAIDKIGVRVLNASALRFTIEHDGTVHREDRLTYSIALSPIGTPGYPVYNVSYSELPDQVFSINALLDTCYLVSVNISNCVGETEHFSTHFILPALRNDTLTRNSLTEFCWYNYRVNDTCPEPYGVDFTQQNTFSFLIIQNSGIIDNITSFTLMLPTQICFNLPEEHLALDPLHLRIYINGIALTTMDISIPVTDTIPVVVSNIEQVLIIAIPSVICIALLSIVVLVAVVCLFYIVKRKRYYRGY